MRPSSALNSTVLAAVIAGLTLAARAHAHGGSDDNDDNKHAILLEDDPVYTYAELHMAQEVRGSDSLPHPGPGSRMECRSLS